MSRTIKLKDASGVSLIMFIFSLSPIFITLSYAIFYQSNPLSIKYIITLITTIIYLILYGIYYQRKKRKAINNKG